MAVQLNLGLVVAALVTAGCASGPVRVGRVAPRPVVVGGASMGELAFAIVDTPDLVTASSHGRRVVIEDLHASLRHGFVSGFGRDRPSGGRTIVLKVEEVALVPPPVADGDGDGDGDDRAPRTAATGGSPFVLACAVHAPKVARVPRASKTSTVRLRYRAALRDGSGVVAAFASEAYGAPFIRANGQDLSASVTAAIERMFADIATELLGRRVPRGVRAQLPRS